MSATKLIQWVPEILQATDGDILRYGPQAARVRALLDFLRGMSPESAKMARSARETARGAAWVDAYDAAWNAARDTAGGAALAAGDAARLSARDAAEGAAWYAAKAEVVNDLIEPEVYRLLTDPLNVGRVYDLRAPEAGSDFMRLTRQLTPATADDVERIADLSVDPRLDAILAILAGPSGVPLMGSSPLATRLKAARALDRNSALGRRGQ